MKKVYTERSRSAFSLNELLITIAIIGILLVTGIPAFQKFSKSQALYNSAKDVQNAILETQSLSLAPKSSSTNGNLQSYMIIINKPENSYNIYEIKNNIGTVVKNYKLPDNVQFNELIGITTGNTAGINFDIVQRGLISFYEENENGIISIAGKNYSQENPTGGLEIKLNYKNNILPDKIYSLTVHPETAMMEIK